MSQTETLDSQTTENPADAPSEPKRELTEYIILESRSPGTWAELKKVTAASAEYALKELGDAAKQEARYVAVPTRNWHPGRPKVKTVTSLSIEFE